MREDGRGELLDELVVQVVCDDEPLGGVAGLPGVVHPRRDAPLDNRVEVVGGKNDEGVGAAELEHDLLEVAAGDLGDRGAGARGAGQRHAGDPLVGDDVGGLLVGGVDVDIGAFGEAGVVEDLLDGRSRLGTLRCVLQQDRVADAQIWPREPRHLVVREVPRHDPQQDAERRPPDHRVALSVEQLDRLVGQQILGVVGVVLVDRGAVLDLADGVLHRLAHLARR